MKRGTGNINGAKDPNKLRNDHLNIRVNSDDKRSWQDHASSIGITLSDLTIRSLNKAVHEENKE